MASGNNFNNNGSNNNLHPNVPLVCTPEQYLQNRQWLLQRVEMFDQINRRALGNYVQLESDLSRKIAEGDAARQRLQTLQRLANARAIAAPPQQPAMNRAGPSQDSGSVYAQHQQPVTVPPPASMNGSDAFIMSPRAHIANPIPSSATSQQPRTAQVQSFAPYPPPSSSHYTSRATQPVPNHQHHQAVMGNVLHISTKQTVQQPIARAQPSVSRSTSSTQQQQQSNIPTSGSLSSYVHGPQSQVYHSWLNQPAFPPSASGSAKEVPVASSRTFYSSSSSSLAGALGHNLHSKGKAIDRNGAFQDISQSVSRTSIESNGRSNSGEALSRAQASSGSTSFPVNGEGPSFNRPLQTQIQGGVAALESALSSMTDEEFARAQRELAEIARKQSDASYVSSLMVRGNQPTTNVQPSQIIPPTVSIANSSVSSPSVLLAPESGQAHSAQTSRPEFSNGTRSTTPQPSKHTEAPVSNAVNVINSDSLSVPNTQTYHSHAVGSNTAVNPPGAAPQDDSDPSVLLRSSRFTTPPADNNRPVAPLTPASANKKTLARDILRALNRLPEKRKASTPESSASDVDTEPPPKRPFLEPSQDGVMISDIFTMQSMFPLMGEPSDSARIEEVEETPSPQIDRFVVRSPEVLPLEAMTSDVPMVPDSLPSHSEVESRASSEATLDEDTALQPFEDPSVPLFLPTPSPPSTPLREKGEQRIDATSSTSARPRGGSRKPRLDTQFYVEVPTLTPAQRQLFLWKEPPGHVTESEIPFVTEVPTEGESEARANTAGKVSEPIDEIRRHAAWEAVSISSSRLRNRPCLWNDCYYVGNNAISLKAHVSEHVELIPEKEKIFPCWWGDCIRRFNKREALAHHLRNHVKRSIFCAYKGCAAHFTHPMELLLHVESKHPPGSELRPSTKSSVPPLRTLPPLGTMCAYQVINLPVHMAQVSKERRAKLGPWVARNCVGSINLGAPNHTGRNQLRRGAGESELRLMGDRSRYDFLEPWGSTYPQNCADLQSSLVTEEIMDGLVLLPDKHGPQGPLVEHLLMPRVDRPGLMDTGEYAVKNENEGEQPEVDVDVGASASANGEIKMEELATGFLERPLQHHNFPQGLEGSPQPRPSAYQGFLGVGGPQPVVLSAA